jgi:predicted ATPase
MFKLRLNNYRGFLNEEFDFSRVNILIGENSAGKSSIFKFLLALKQSMRSPNNRDYNLTLSGEETDLGNYYETIYNHETDRNLSFTFEFGKEYYDFFLKDTFPTVKDEEEKGKVLEKKNEVANYLTDADSVPTILTFEVCNDLSNHKNIVFSASNSNIGTAKIVFSHTENIAEQNIYLIGDSPKCEILFESKYYEQTLSIKDVEYEKQAFLTIVSGDTLKDKIQVHSGLDKSEFERLFWHIGYLLIAQNYLQMLLRQIEYINPLLHKVAERVYVESDKKKTRQVKNIKDLIDFLDTSTTKKAFEVKLTNLLKEFGIAESFTLKKEGFTREFRVKVNNLENNIKDVGFGVSLQLPIFAQAIVSEGTTAIKNNGNEIFAGETLLIEQPEVHLHPRLQAKFIETLLSIGNNNFYFIETHSEHIIRMLQVLVKTKKFDIKSDNISIQYFRKEGKKMVKSNHYINPETGKLSPNFPKGFYDVSYDLAFQLMD